MFSCHRFLPWFAIAVVTLLVACGNEAKQPLQAKTIEDRFPIKVGEHIVQMQIALLPLEQQKGLMYRRTIEENEGMIFVSERPQQQSFWMRNTEIPLDIGYFDAAGELKEIYPMYPHDERQVISSSTRIQFSLEMNQGWFSRQTVRAGAKLDMIALGEAIRARGLKPERYGIY